MSTPNEAINIKKRMLEVAAADTANLVGIFVMFMKEAFKQFLEDYARYLMFPFAALGGWIQTYYTWKQGKLDNWTKGPISKFVLEFLSSAAISVAVIGGFAASALFALATPIIFTATLAIKTLYHAGAACVNYGMSLTASNEADKQKYKAEAKGNAIAAFSLACTTVAVGLVLLAAKPIYALLGVLGGLVACGYAVYNRFSLGKLSSKADKATATNNEEEQKPLLNHIRRSELSPKLSNELKGSNQKKLPVKASKFNPNQGSKNLTRFALLAQNNLQDEKMIEANFHESNKTGIRTI